jgi:hypothetical protein
MRLPDLERFLVNASVSWDHRIMIISRTRTEGARKEAMSEYQHYEFQAIDRPLTENEMEELRSFSTRARITPTSFINEYSWGSFKGDEDAWMEKYFDAFLYLANWGTHVFKLRLPVRLLDEGTARLYCAGEHAFLREKNGKIILTFVSEDEPDDAWAEGSGELSSLISTRSELARGDLRALYLGWLLCAQNGDLDDDAIEPPVPAGLADLSASLEALVEFLRIDIDLLDAAATASPPLVHTEPDPPAVRAWLAELSAADKDDILTRLMTEIDGALANELVQRMRRERECDQDAGDATSKRRTVAELLRAGEQAAEERRRIAAEKAAREREQQERAAARTRAKHLDKLAGKEPVLWENVASLIATKQPKSYDRAVNLLVDLRDLALRQGGGDFARRVDVLRTAHVRKPTFLERLHKAGL